MLLHSWQSTLDMPLRDELKAFGYVSRRRKFFRGSIVYRVYDEGGHLLYVGVTDDITTRFGHHRKKSKWYAEMHHLRCEIYDNRSGALAIERLAIKTEHPIYNIKGAPTNG